jgi:hypothetical protein
MRRYTGSSVLRAVVCGAGCCILFGFLFYGRRFMTVRAPAFLFVISGVAGSVFYAVLRWKGLRKAALTMFCLYILDLIVFRVTVPVTFVTQFLYLASLAVVVYVYDRFIRAKFPRIKVGKFVAFAVMLAALRVAVMAAQASIFSFPHIPIVLTETLRFQLLIGTGLGLGLEIAELVPSILTENGAVED